MKIAIISDIHGNMQSLETVLADIEQEKCEKIFCLGDLAMAGPEPLDAVMKIKELQKSGKLELIQGNTDKMIAYGDVSIPLVKKAFPIMGNALEDDVKVMPEDLKEYLKNLPEQKELEIEGVKILLVHGSPRKNDENILPDMPIEQVEKMLENTTADVIFCGHTHIPCGYQTNDKKTLVNVGSVGRPFTDEPKACYVIAEFVNGKTSIQHKFIDYDKTKASKILAQRAFDGAEKLSQILIKPEFRHI